MTGVQTCALPIFIAMGKADGMTPEKLCEFIQEETGEKDLMIRDAEIFPHFSFVTVPFAQAEALLEIFKDKKRGRKPLVELAQRSRGRNSRDTSESRSSMRSDTPRSSYRNSSGNYARETRTERRSYSSY